MQERTKWLLRFFAGASQLPIKIPEQTWVKTLAERGASILDILLWLVIATALVTIAIPALAVLREEETVRLESERVFAALHQAKIQAQSFDRTVLLHVQLHEVSAYWDSLQGGKIFWMRLNNRVSLSLSSNVPDQINFFRTGVATPATLLLRGSSLHCTYRISIRSRVTKSCHWTKST